MNTPTEPENYAPEGSEMHTLDDNLLNRIVHGPSNSAERIEFLKRRIAYDDKVLRRYFGDNYCEETVKGVGLLVFHEKKALEAKLAKLAQ